MSQPPVKQLAWRTGVAASRLAARPTAPLRSFPEYLIVGAQRAGTTSLYKYLIQHPGVMPARLTKGVHWFDVAYDKPPSWYRVHFPMDRSRARLADQLGYRPVTGEGSPYYLFHPYVPQRIAEHMPDARIIVVLRDPVARAWSAYHHERKRGFETLSFEAALDAEPERLAGQDQLLAAPDGRSYDHLHHAYVGRGQYLTQLERLWAALPRPQTLVVFSDDLEQQPVETMAEVQEFLGLPAIAPVTARRWNKQDNDELDPRLRARLEAAFAESDAALAARLGRPLPWSR